MSKLVIDVSHHQGIINWDKVKNNIDGAILRCGYGNNVESQDDRQWKRNIAECERLGIPRGVYLYSYATNKAEAESELQHILRLIKGHEFQLPIYIDVEEGYTKSFAPTTCKIVCEGLKKAGYVPGVYANLYWWNTYLTGINDYTRWVAQYNTVCTYKKPYDIWQYTSSGSIPGITGRVDMNHCYKDFEDFGTGSVEKPVTPPKKSNATIADEVIAGKWGDGAERKKALEAAGYDYDAIQDIVNEKLSNKKSNETIANEVIAGKWGVGKDREKALEAAGYDYDAIQDIVNKKLKPSKPSSTVVKYKIKPGDTLEGIAKKFKTTVKAIQNLNGIKNPNMIYAGTVIRVK